MSALTRRANAVLMQAYLGLKREEGQTFVEYAIIGLVVAVAVAGLLATFKDKIGSALTDIGAKL